MQHDYYLWLCFSDKGVIYLNGKLPLNNVEYILKQYHKCKDFECHYVNEETILIALKSFLEDCFGLEYTGVLYE